MIVVSRFKYINQNLEGHRFGNNMNIIVPDIDSLLLMCKVFNSNTYYFVNEVIV